MTEKQKDIVIGIFQTGMACGLSHPYEFFVNYIRSFMNFLPYDDIPKKEKVLKLFEYSKNKGRLLD